MLQVGSDEFRAAHLFNYSPLPESFHQSSSTGPFKSPKNIFDSVFHYSPSRLPLLSFSILFENWWWKKN
jgi:hypothetical protein